MFAWVKFLRHDFNGINELLDINDDYYEELRYRIWLYEKVLTDVKVKLHMEVITNEEKTNLLRNVKVFKDEIFCLFERFKFF